MFSIALGALGRKRDRGEGNGKKVFKSHGKCEAGQVWTELVEVLQ